MKKRIIEILVLLSVLPLVAVFGCGGSGSHPIRVTVSPATVPLTAGATQQFTATITGSKSTAITWALSGCSGSACGKISAGGLYTAPDLIPDSKTVTVSAALQSDSAKTGAALVTLSPLKVKITEASIDLSQGQTHQFTANVTGHPNKSVTWSLSDCSGDGCGAIRPDGMYTAPVAVTAGASVTVMATSQADTTKSDSAVVHLKAPPISVSVSPASATVATNKTQTFTATLQNDSTNAGVTWALGPNCDTACGTLSDETTTTVTYAAPASVPVPSTITLTATSVADASGVGTANVTIISSPILQPGYYAFVYSGWQVQWKQDWFLDWYYTQNRYSMAGRFHLDDSGNITEGIEDANAASGTSLAQPFAGTYTIAPDHTGSFTIATASETATYQMTVDASGKRASFIRYDNAIPNFLQNGAGYFELQDDSAFALAGSYAVGITGGDFSVVGRMDVDSSGLISNGTADAVDHSSSYEHLTLTGSFGAPASDTGRGTASFTLAPQPGSNSGSLNAVYYIVAPGKILLVQTDDKRIGEMEKQDQTYSTSLLKDPFIVQMSGGNGNDKQSGVAGLISPDGSGSIGGELDQNMESSVSLEQSVSGTYAVDPSGRVAMTVQAGGAANDLIAYLFGDNQGFVIQTTGSDALYGSFKPQSGGPFTTSSVSGSFRDSSFVPILVWSENDVGLTGFDGSANITLVSDFNYWSGGFADDTNQNNTTGTYTLAPNGRGDLSIELNGAQWPLVFWVISPDEAIAIDTVSSQDSLPILMKFDRVSGNAASSAKTAPSSAGKQLRAPRRPRS